MSKNNLDTSRLVSKQKYTKIFPKKTNQETYSFKTFEKANEFSKLKGGQIFKEKKTWKVRVKRSAK